MYILGLSHPISRNSAACLIKDDNIIAFAEEERFNRIKHSTSLPPLKSIDYCLEAGGISLKDIDLIGLGYDSLQNIFRANFFQNFKTFVSRIRPTPFKATSYCSLTLRQRIQSGLLDYLTSYYHGLMKMPFSFNDKRVRFIRHHIAHIASSFYVSPFNKACIISADGGGGQEAGMLAVAEGHKVRILKTIPSSSSLGELYSTITSLLGFEHHDGEGKVMGLAAYGERNGKILPFVNFKNGIAVIDRVGMNGYLTGIKNKLRQDPLNKTNTNLAATLQETIERAYIYMASYLYKETGIRNFCLTGGVSLNCLANTKVLTSGFVDDVFIQPASHDAGTALGAALQIYVDIFKKRPPIKFRHAYWGPEFTNEQIKKNIEKAEVPYCKYLRNTEKTVAKLLFKRHIIGWFQGRMEVGPRALGNRSILADPSDPKMKNKINDRIKGREPWRPFAPSILEEYAKEYLLDITHSPFMILESRVTPQKANDIISATHVDGTTRPQTVSKKINPKYWNLINEFKNLTGIPALLNTSFNISDEPIVCTPMDALSTFFRTGLDYLILGDYLISKKPISIGEV